jgi:hypothetical protein
VYVLPGFVALFVAGFISDLPEVRDVQLPVVYIALTTLSVLLPLAVVHVYGRRSGYSFPLDGLATSPKFVASVFMFSLLLGILFGVANTTDYVSRLLRSVFGKNLIMVSSQSEPFSLLLKTAGQADFADEHDGHPSKNVPEEIQQFTTRYARFTFDKDGDATVYEGVVASFSERTERRQAYLTPACIIEGDTAIPIKGPGVWLNLEHIASVQFVYRSCSKCAAKLDQFANFKSELQCPF